MLGRQRLIVRRTRLVGTQAELWPDWRHHAFLTNRTEALELVESEHRRHAVVELAIRDLKDQALAHFPSGRFLANAAWTVIAALAHNLLRWTTLIGLPDTVIPTARTVPPPTAHRSRPDHPHRPHSDTPDASPLAMGTRLPHRAKAPARDASAPLTARESLTGTIDAGPRPQPAQNTTIVAPRPTQPRPNRPRHPRVHAHATPASSPQPVSQHPSTAPESQTVDPGLERGAHSIALRIPEQRRPRSRTRRPDRRRHSPDFTPPRRAFRLPISP